MSHAGYPSAYGLPARRQEKRAWTLTVLLCGALVTLCYGFSLRLPFLFDDLPVMNWLNGHSLLEVWTQSSENAYYRPLTFTVYKLGLAFPKGTQQVILHAANVLVHWFNALLVGQVAALGSGRAHRSVRQALAAILFALYPFLFRAIPWVTAFPHTLVLMLTLVAAYAALRAEAQGKARWWVISLLATALAPLAHESGLVCAVIVGGLVVIQHGMRGSRRRIACIVLGGLLNAAAIWLRGRLPGTGAFDPDGLNSWFENLVFYLHGLVYPVGPAIGWLARTRGWHDFAMIQVSSAALGLLVAWLVRRRRDGRWVARALWWWAWGSLPAAVTFRFGGLVNSPRFYALGSVGVVMLWADIIVELGAMARPGWARQMAWALLTASIALPNLSFLLLQRQVHLSLNHVYQQILDAARQAEHEPLGFVNVPAWLAPKRQTYALSKDGVVGLPLYTNVREFIGVNLAWREADNVMFVHTLYEPQNLFFGFHGDWLDWEQMRQFARDHRTVWLTRYEEGRFELRQVGSIQAAEEGATPQPLAWFQGGPAVESAKVQDLGEGRWALELTWRASEPIPEGSQIFVHVVDRGGNLVAQADGPALGGMVPLPLWQPGDRVVDVRYLALSRENGPFTALVGIYDPAGRFPAYTDDGRCPNDAAPVATIGF